LIVYLHGLNSAGTSGKAAVLRERLVPIEVYSPSYPAQSASLAIETLGEELARLVQARLSGEPLLLVGSSMGGFYGAWLAGRLGFDHLVMINPALTPWELLRQAEGWQFNQVLDERYYLSAEMVAATRGYATRPQEVGLAVSLLLDQGDELIDYRQAVQAYRDIADIHVFAGGSHTFEHMDEAVEIIGRLHRSLQTGSGQAG
jgi:uncharacterized protein